LTLVGVVIESASDEALVQGTIEVLEQMKIDYEVRAISAHRTPERVQEYAVTARDRGIEVLISASGGSAALAGVLASWTTIPVIGVPLAYSTLNGWDSLLATVQMPEGIPVACMAVGESGARNAAFFAAEILGLSHEEIRQAYEDYRKQLRDR
tara:strand:- start:412 stop:870 length:459 start_codon:yes stop_codon:yes gene_type:complete